MLSLFYKRYSVHLLLLAMLSLPWLYIRANSLPANNDIETWLPHDSEVRVSYDQFKDHFGAEEVILVALERSTGQERLIESVCSRLERLPQVRHCWSPARLVAIMRELGVREDDIRRRLTGLALSEDGELAGIIVLLTPAGIGDRAGTVRMVRNELEYCQLSGDCVMLAGAPVIVTELDRLGSPDANSRFFSITLLISLCLLYFTLRQWKLALSILGLTVWAIELTLTIIGFAGGEQNFILGALSVMVMVFTLAVTIHFLHYYVASLDHPDPLSAAMRLAWKPCFLATATTTIGLVSLAVSNMIPVSQFGYSAALGSVIALITGLGLTPALLTVFPYDRRVLSEHRPSAHVWTDRIIGHARPITLLMLVLVGVTGVGLLNLESKIDPLDFLPRDSRVLTDVQRIERDLTDIDSIEAVVDFGDAELPFVEKLDCVRRIESIIAGHPGVRHTMSLATFFPERLPENPLAVASLLSRARSRQEQSDFIARDDQLWRISARINNEYADSQYRIYEELTQLTQGEPVSYTGVAPLLDAAQREIFEGFWKSFTTAFGIITLVMFISLRSLRTGMIAMIPNLTPICIVFGMLGWIGFPVDIGMMMSGSIALGIAVDGTFHYLLRYQSEYNHTGDSAASAHKALRQTGAPIFQAAVIAAVGMLALTMSSFAPTMRFGFLMATLLLAAVIGDLVALPSLLCLRPNRRPADGTPEQPGRRRAVLSRAARAFSRSA